ncbi:hypothetical protein ACFE04_022697 [Oxalis oulophora]
MKTSKNDDASNERTKSSSSKPPKSSDKKKEVESVDNSLQADIASFASSLGLASSLPSSGFNDTDFRKKGPTAQKPKPHQNKKTNQATNVEEKDDKNKNSRADPSKPKLTPKPPVLSLEDGANNNNNAKKFEKFKNMPKLPIVKAGVLGLWYEDALELEKKVLGEEAAGKKVIVKDVEEWKNVVEAKREIGERLMWQYNADYEGSRGQHGDIKMLATTQRSGTAADRVSAFSVMIADNPIANMRSLDALIGMVTSKVGKRHALTGFETLKELFISSLLPDRKLKTLLQQPVDKLPENKDGHSLLLFWYWEDCLKQRYERFVIALEEASRDMLPALKDKSTRIIFALLKSKSEQERRLLSALVNKLGDPQNKGASNADFHLANLLSEHPNMRVVVIDEVDSFLFRPHLGMRSKYHAVNFLSQIRLSHNRDGPKAAKRLIDVYFALFKVLITGASGSKKGGKRVKEQDKKTADASTKNKENTSEEPKHVELDSRLLSALLTGINRAFPYVSSTESDDVIEVHTPVLFQLVHSTNFNVGVQALMLLDKISSKNQIVSDRFYRALYSKLLLPAAMNSSKAEMFIGLLLRAMKNDVNLRRVAAFSKRVLQVALQQPPQFACGCLFLLSEVLKARPPLWNMVAQDESVDEELEHFEDIELLIREDAKDVKKPKTLSDVKGRQPATRSFLPGGFDPRHREPSYCNADRASWWELMVLASHVHPSVATMAKTLLSGANVIYNGNPLNDLSLTAFLDKFMEKKPKQSTWHGGSNIEPAKKLDMNHNLIGPEILSLEEADVPPEDLIFHKFYMNKANTSKKTKKKKKKISEDSAGAELFEVDGDEVDGGDESDNEEIENMLDSANAALEDEDYDYDDLDKIADHDDDDLVDEDAGKKQKKKKQKKAGASPFASLEEYEHLMKDAVDETGEERRNKKRNKSEKKGSSKAQADDETQGKPKKKKHKSGKKGSSK